MDESKTLAKFKKYEWFNELERDPIGDRVLYLKNLRDENLQQADRRGYWADEYVLAKRETQTIKMAFKKVKSQKFLACTRGEVLVSDATGKPVKLTVAAIEALVDSDPEIMYKAQELFDAELKEQFFSEQLAAMDVKRSSIKYSIELQLKNPKVQEDRTPADHVRDHLNNK